MENITMVLQRNLERIVEIGEDVEQGIFENMMAHNFEGEPTTLANNYFE